MALRKSPSGFPGGRRTPASAARQGSPAYLAGSCARCCPSLRRGAALVTGRSGCPEANYPLGRGPGPGSGSGASRLHGRAGGRQLRRAPAGRRWWREEEAEPPARPAGSAPASRGLQPRREGRGRGRRIF